MYMNPNILYEKIKEINFKYPNINYGGCGTFSYYLQKTLNDKYHIKTDIVYIESDYPPAGKPDYDIKFSHIMIKWNDIYIDNNGFYNLNEELENLSSQKLEEMIHIPELWNTIFNNSQTYKLIQDIYSI